MEKSPLIMASLKRKASVVREERHACCCIFQWLSASSPLSSLLLSLSLSDWCLGDPVLFLCLPACVPPLPQQAAHGGRAVVLYHVSLLALMNGRTPIWAPDGRASAIQPGDAFMGAATAAGENLIKTLFLPTSTSELRAIPCHLL